MASITLTFFKSFSFLILSFIKFIGASTGAKIKQCHHSHSGSRSDETRRENTIIENESEICRQCRDISASNYDLT